MNKKVLGAALCIAALALPASPAHAAAAGSGADITLDTTSGRFVSGGGNYTITPAVNSSRVTVAFECHATAGPDASQTRIRPSSEGGCVLYKGGTPYYASGQSAPGPATATTGTASVDLAIGGRFQLCWNVSATYLANGGVELSNSGCTAVNA